MASIIVGQAFPSLVEVKVAIKLAISEQHESYVVDYSDKTRFRSFVLLDQSLLALFKFELPIQKSMELPLPIRCLIPVAQLRTSRPRTYILLNS
jgi:hypothetical protein